jgi:hypothetical protein
MIEIPIWFILVFTISFLFLCMQMIVIYILINSRQLDIISKQIELMGKMLANQNTVIVNKDDSFDAEKIIVDKKDKKFNDFSEVSLDDASLILSDKFNNEKLNKNFDSVGLKNECENEKNSDIVNKLKGIKNVDNN